MAIQKPMRFQETFVGGHAQVYRDDFHGNADSLTDDRWEQEITGGGSITLDGASAVTLAVSASAGDETVLSFRNPVQWPFRAHTVFNAGGGTLTNQQIDIWLESVDPETFQPNGLNTFGIRLDSGTTTSQIKTARKGAGDAEQVTAALSHGNTVWTSVQGYEFEMDPDGCTVWPVNSEGVRNAGSFFYNNRMPNHNAWYILRMRIKNTGASAANTLKVHWMLIQENVEVSAEISGGRSYQYASSTPGLVPVQIAGGTTVSASGSYSGSTTKHHKKSTADTNATLLKSTSGRVVALHIFNTSAAVKFLKLYNKSTAPVVGTDVPVMVVPLAVGMTKVDWPVYGSYFSSGISYAITGAVADTDTTTVAANDVIVNMEYI